MLFGNIPIRKKLLRIIFLINVIELFVPCIAFFSYEYYAFRKTTIEKVSTIGQIVSANSTASLAFDNSEDAGEILAALKAEPHIVTARIYDLKGNLFCKYSRHEVTDNSEIRPEGRGYRFRKSYLEGFEPILQNGRQLGTLYLKSDLGAMYERLRLYAIIVTAVFILSFMLAYFPVQLLTKSITVPILTLAGTAEIISTKQDYSVRASKMGNDELGSLTDAFNQMLDQIQRQDIALREFNETLEQKVKDRTTQLESVNKELESFSYSVSHDLRAPLRAIIGYTAILEEEYAGNLDDEGKRISSVIKKNTLKMGQLIDELLSFSRMSRQDITKDKIDMSEMVSEVRESLASQYDFTRIQWALQPLPTARANANMIRQVWMNLITNAIKYSSKKDKAHIEIGSFSRDGNTAFFVRDDGVGFNQKYQDKLFKIFQRLHSIEDFEGTGVGLALVEKIVTKHGGSVWAEGELNKGASFYFSLPK
jgi:signal transduction histidine kinase